MIQYAPVTGEFNLTGKTAIITGGAGTIGTETAKMYARKGANLVLVDVKDEVSVVADNFEKEFGINVNGVAPTVVRTYMGDRAWKGEVKERMLKAIPAN